MLQILVRRRREKSDERDRNQKWDDLRKASSDREWAGPLAVSRQSCLRYRQLVLVDLEILSFPLDEQKCALPWHFHLLRMFLKIESGDSFVWEARMSGTVSESLQRTHKWMLKNASRQQGPQGHLGRQSCWHLLCSREHGTGHKRNVLWSFKYELVGTRESGCFQGPSRQRWTELVTNQKKKITSCALRSHGYILLWRLKAGNLDWTASSRGKELHLLLINIQF